MKKIIFVMIVACLSAFSVQAKWGVQAGATFTTQNLLDYDGPNVFHTATGRLAGITYDVNFGLGLGMNTGLLFIKRNIEQESSSSKALYRYSSIEFPINLKYQIPFPVIFPFVMGGPYIDYGRRQKQWGHKVSYDTWRDRMGGGFTFGAGVDIFKTIRVMYQCDWGVNSFIQPGTDGSGSPLRTGLYRAETRGSRVSIGILF